MNEVDKDCGPISWLKRHDHVGPFDGIDPLEGKLLLTGKSNSKFVVTHQCVKHPVPSPMAKLLVYSWVTPRNWVRNEMSDWVKGNIFDTELPDKVINAVDMLLIWFS